MNFPGISGLNWVVYGRVNSMGVKKMGFQFEKGDLMECKNVRDSDGDEWGFHQPK